MESSCRFSTRNLVCRSSCKSSPTQTLKNWVLPLFLCRHHRSALSYKARNIPYPLNRRRIPKNSDNREAHQYVSFPSKCASTGLDRGALLRSKYTETWNQAPHVDGQRNHQHFFPQSFSCALTQLFSVSCSSLNKRRQWTLPRSQGASLHCRCSQTTVTPLQRGGRACRKLRQFSRRRLSAFRRDPRAVKTRRPHRQPREFSTADVSVS